MFKCKHLCATFIFATFLVANAALAQTIALDIGSKAIRILSTEEINRILNGVSLEVVAPIRKLSNREIEIFCGGGKWELIGGASETPGSFSVERNGFCVRGRNCRLLARGDTGKMYTIESAGRAFSMNEVEVKTISKNQYCSREK